MATYTLIHGGMHGSWCWASLESELQALGHSVVTVDYPCDDATLGSGDFAAIVASQMPDESTIVVAHSMSGLMAPILPFLKPVDTLVFLCALVPDPGVSFIEQSGVSEWPSAAPDVMQPDDQGRVTFTRENAKRYFYSDVEEALASRCIDRLTPQSLLPLGEPSPLEKWPNVPLVSIYATEDPIITTTYSTDRGNALGMSLIDVGGGHSPFLVRPKELAGVLDGLAPLTASTAG